MCKVVNHREGSQRPRWEVIVVKVGQAQQSVGASESFSVKKKRGRRNRSGLYPKTLREKSAGWIRVCRWLVIGLVDSSPRLSGHVPMRRSQQTERATINRAHAMSFAARAPGDLRPFPHAASAYPRPPPGCVSAPGCGEDGYRLGCAGSLFLRANIQLFALHCGGCWILLHWFGAHSNR